ncbi:MAG: extracellular solute-binding protein [Aquiluna sp.]|nr:extracellular solute-binding protein [Aquiluna sp.]
MAKTKRLLSLLGLAAASGLVLSGCATQTTTDSATTDSADGGTSSTEEQKVLQFWAFGDMGLGDLIAEYEAANPDIKINMKVSDFDPHHQGLLTSLDSAAPDIAAIEVGYSSLFKAVAAKFVDMREFGAEALEDDYLDWRWAQGVDLEGRVFGIPTDVGPMTICYRSDLFAAAGLPTDRDEVSALWPTWEDFIATGEKYVAATGDSFLSSTGYVWNAVKNQSDEKFYSADGSTLVYDTNPQIKKAWDLSVAATPISANIGDWTADWNAGMNNGAYAVLTCPAWMMGYIQSQAPDLGGSWDVATMPEGGGNWGGSQLTIPARAQYPAEAAAFITWVLSAENQQKLFEKSGQFPSTVAAYESESLLSFESEYFSNAPVGEIYATGVTQLVPLYEGPKERVIDQEFGAALGRIANGDQTPGEAYESAIENIKRDVG